MWLENVTWFIKALKLTLNNLIKSKIGYKDILANLQLLVSNIQTDLKHGFSIRKKWHKNWNCQN